jgi:hypothetical protein
MLNSTAITDTLTRAQRPKANVDSLDGFLLVVAGVGYAAFATWTSLIVRAIRGEEVKEDWRVVVSTAGLMTAFTVLAGTRIREIAAMRGAAVETRALVLEAAEDAQRRDQRAVEQQDRLNALTKRLVMLAALTLAAAVVTLVVSVVLAI